MSELRNFLRTATNPLHRELDTLVGGFRDRAGYERFLLGTFRHRAPVEAALQATGRSWRGRALVPLLERDLADLALEPPVGPSFVLSNDIASVLGAAYVIEGSALGARVLVKGLPPLGLGADHGALYLTTQAAGIEGWRRLLTDLETLGRHEWERAAAAAGRVFGHAIAAFSAKEPLTA